MKKLLLLSLLTLSIVANAQVTDGCKVLIGALPNLPQYKKFKLLAPVSCDQDAAVTYYSFGTHDDQLIFSVILTDTKPIANEPSLGDAKTKYLMAKASKNPTAVKVSRFALGAETYVSHDVHVGIRRFYGYQTILKNRYILNILVNDPSLLNLDDFQDFIADYLSRIKESTLPK